MQTGKSYFSRRTSCSTSFKGVSPSPTVFLDAVNVPIDELRSRLAELPAGRPIVTYCQVGQRGYLATRILRQLGNDAVNLSGGYRTYRLWQPNG